MPTLTVKVDFDCLLRHCGYCRFQIGDDMYCVLFEVDLIHDPQYSDNISSSKCVEAGNG